ncbi:hypothetical protein ACWIGW_12070 [Nocardia brasiliensis]
MRRYGVLPRGGASAVALREVEESIDRCWGELLGEQGVAAGSGEEVELARLVVDDPGAFEWRVVDAALDLLDCAECGEILGSGPSGCARCELMDGFRYSAREIDRPGVPPRNEHAVRVASVVARNRHRYSARARCGYELCLPWVWSGGLPTTPEAQALKAKINRLSDEQLESVTSIEDVSAYTA